MGAPTIKVEFTIRTEEDIDDIACDMREFLEHWQPDNVQVYEVSDPG